MKVPSELPSGSVKPQQCSARARPAMVRGGSRYGHTTSVDDR